MNLAVYHKDGTEFYIIKEFTLAHTYMGERKITAKVFSQENINFEVGAYVMLGTEKFSTFHKTVVTKTATTGIGIGDAMQYDLIFYAPYKIMETINFEDYVTQNDTNVYYTGTSTFDFYNNITELAYRLQANFDRFLGANVWNVTVSEYADLTEYQVSVSENTLWEGLLLTQSVFNQDFFIDGTNIILGGTGTQIPETLYYGKNKGLYEISRHFEVNNKIITRLKSYGSNRNLPQDYLRDEDARGRYYTQLMLPNFAITKIDYVDAPQDIIDEYGIREGIHTFDDVYPSIEEIDLGEGRIDEIVGVDPIDPTSDYFWITTRDLGFDINNYLNTVDTKRISIKGTNADGSPTYLGGYEFEIVRVEGTRIKLKKNQADNTILPDDVSTVRVGDRFVLLGIAMPEVYITNAENKLKIKAQEYMANDVGEYLTYNIKLDEIFIEKTGFGDDIMAGYQINIEDNDLVVANYLPIQNLTIKYGNEILPSYEIKLSKVKALTLKEQFSKTNLKQSTFNYNIKNIANFNTTNNKVTVKEIDSDITWG